jgi:hypothetical protein
MANVIIRRRMIHLHCGAGREERIGEVVWDR